MFYTNCNKDKFCQIINSRSRYNIANNEIVDDDTSLCLLRHRGATVSFCVSHKSAVLVFKHHLIVVLYE